MSLPRHVVCAFPPITDDRANGGHAVFSNAIDPVLGDVVDVGLALFGRAHRIDFFDAALAFTVTTVVPLVEDVGDVPALFLDIPASYTIGGHIIAAAAGADVDHLLHVILLVQRLHSQTGRLR
jgi:hypothetical protein